MMWRLAAFYTVLFVVAHEGKAQSYVAEGYFVVDDEAVQRYVREIHGTASQSRKRTQAVASITQDIEYFLTEVNKLLATLQSGGLNMQIKKRRVEVLDKNILVRGFTGVGVLPTNTALETFKDWLDKQNSYVTLNFDFAILWTGFDLEGRQGNRAAGIAYEGTVCLSNLASGVVEFSGYYSTVIHTAKSIASILGASEDGPAVKNVMNNNLKPADEDRWRFSSCAARDIVALIPSVSCLGRPSPSSTTPSSSLTLYNGSLFDPNVICQRGMKDSRSYMCKFPNLYDGQNPSGNVICQHITCWVPGTTTCVDTYTSEGLVCNRNGICDDGTCVTDSSSRSRNVEAGCVYGDQKRLYFPDIEFDGTCKEFISEYGKDECYGEGISTACCATCKAKCTGPAGCKCGDRASNCADYTQNQVCPQYKDSDCCEYCQGFKKKRSIFGAEYNVTLVLNVTDHETEVTAYKVVHESIIREVE